MKTNRERLSERTAGYPEDKDLDKEMLKEKLSVHIHHPLLNDILTIIDNITFVIGKAGSLCDYDTLTNKVNFSALLKTKSPTRIVKSIDYIYAGLVRFYLAKIREVNGYPETNKKLLSMALTIYYKGILKKFSTSYSDEERDVKVYRLVYASFRDCDTKSRGVYIPSKTLKYDPKKVDYDPRATLGQVIQETFTVQSIGLEQLKIYNLVNHALFDFLNNDFQTIGDGMYSENVLTGRDDSLALDFNRLYHISSLKKRGFQ